MPIENEYLQSLPSGLRATENTSEIAKFIGKKTGLSPLKVDFFVTGNLGRASGYFMIKPSMINPFSGLVRKEYFTSGRTISGYYEFKTKNDQDYKAIREDLSDLTDAQQDNVVVAHRETLYIDKLLKVYRGIEDVESQEANDLRNEITAEINSIEKPY